MIGMPPQRRGWALAAGLSVAVHAAAAGVLIWRPSLPLPKAGPLQLPQIEVTTLLPAPQDAATQAGEVLTSAVAPLAQEELAPAAPAPDERLTPLSEPALLSTGVQSPAPEALTPAAPELPPETGQATAPDSAVPPLATAQTGPAPDPRLLQLFERIRNRLTDPCLLALPVLRPDDSIQLNILASDDRQIAQLTQALTRDLDIPVTREAVLIDQRQCPGITFARNDPLYPSLGIGLQLESQQIDSGMSLRGRIVNGAGYYNTLLLVDDNGVVHDLRRFLIVSAGSVSFDVPLARAGLSRDTHQLVIAIATQGRPASVARHAGKLAADFFDPLAQELASGTARVGISSVYVR